MISTLLFDWGDTLMIDFPDQSGKMCHWDRVAAVEGAAQTLATLCQTYQIYVATGAADSSEADIRQAFQRVDLDRYIQGYFCTANLGVGKDSPEFFPRILTHLDCSAAEVAMIGDHFERDIQPALRLGIRGYWLAGDPHSRDNCIVCPQLTDLLMKKYL